MLDAISLALRSNSLAFGLPSNIENSDINFISTRYVLSLVLSFNHEIRDSTQVSQLFLTVGRPTLSIKPLSVLCCTTFPHTFLIIDLFIMHHQHLSITHRLARLRNNQRIPFHFFPKKLGIDLPAVVIQINSCRPFLELRLKRSITNQCCWL